MPLFRLLRQLACLTLLAGCSSPTATAVVSAAPAPAAHKLLLISIDGLRADVLDQPQSRQRFPNLTRLASEGVRARWMTPSYPSLTFPNHYSIVTGLRPDHHGIVANTIRDPKLGEFKLNRREAISNAGWWGGEPIWVGGEKADIRTATWAWPGSEAPIQGRHPSRWRRYDGSVPAPMRVDVVLGWLGETGNDAPRLMTLYFEQVDHAGHEYGPQSPEYLHAIAEVDAALGRLLDGMTRLRVLDRSDIVLVSDHGMASTAPERTLPLEQIVPANLGSVVSDGAMIGIEPLPGQTAALEARLLGAHAHYDCWRKRELPARWHYGSHSRIPALICQMHEGWLARPARKRTRGDVEHGSHGYDPTLPSMHAVFIARGPSFVQGGLLAPFDNVDVYPLLTRLLGIQAAVNDGNPATLLPALRAGAATAP